MAVFRVEKTKDYTVMSNYHLKEKEMSLKAKGLLSLMLSLPDNWNYTKAGLIAICKENECAIDGALKELQDFGYLTIEKMYPNATETGRIEYKYTIYENPRVEKQGVENLGVEKPVQLNTKELNTKNNIPNKEYIVENDIIKKATFSNKVYNIVNYLNQVAHTNFKPETKSTFSLIKARLKNGFKEEDFYQVIDNKWADWQNTEFQQYMRPTTLFGNKFENYLNSKIVKTTPKTFADNTSSHFTGNKPITDERFFSMTHRAQVEYLNNMAVADMTKAQREIFNEYCLARDEDGNLIQF